MDTSENTSHDSHSKLPTKVVSRKHSILTDLPKDRNCERRKRTKITPRAEKFGDLITADHKVLSEGCESQSYPCKTKTSQETEKSLQKFLDLSENPKVIYTDNSLEFGEACEEFNLESLYVNTSQFRNEWNC